MASQNIQSIDLSSLPFTFTERIFQPVFSFTPIRKLIQLLYICSTSSLVALAIGLKALGLLSGTPPLTSDEKERGLHLLGRDQTYGRHEFVSTPDGQKLHVVIAGPEDAKDTILLIHGFPECWYMWRTTMPWLVEQGYRVCAVNMRGYALSSKPEGFKAYEVQHLVNDMVAVVDYLNTPRTHVVAHDWGGIVAWTLLHQHPTRIQSLTIINSPHPLCFRRNTTPSQLLRSWYIYSFQPPYLAEKLMVDYSFDFVEDKDARLVYRSNVTDEGTLTAMVNYYRAFARGREIRLPELGVNGQRVPPVMVIWGENDTALGLKESLAGVEKSVEGVQVRQVKGRSHWIVEEEDGRYVKEVLDPCTARSEESPCPANKLVKMVAESRNRLYVKGRHLSYQRGKRNTNPDVSLIKIEGCDTKEESQFYLGKRIAYVYKAKTEIRGTKIRVIWG
ncbi:hypothetical protein G7K_1798-t2 [Saitoella complicata NRRL Y-17804]|uniref:AB hydrolase-1 domain-containing protein n=1 Tax=Saitoella complicata (strain BCRC 22490 / CBS 7301 / JCM 7358 / NBRC 10748 / NRRL Y-17804) TaxID=698492 RepID=A0A0E9NCK2_SAICN|nr:hypothetical protein G7K_1798-t2 [Saitoella complicata NRRL Y-17804]